MQEDCGLVRGVNEFLSVQKLYWVETNKRDYAETGIPLEFCLPNPELEVMFFAPLAEYFLVNEGRVPPSAIIINEPSS